MIKSWGKYNESKQELTEDMVLDIVYFRNFTILGVLNTTDVMRRIDICIDSIQEFDFVSDDLIFSNKEGYLFVQDCIGKIYKLSKKNDKFKQDLISIYELVKKFLGKTGFSEYEDYLVEYMDEDFEIEYTLRPSDCMEIEVRKAGMDINQHIAALSRVQSTVNRISKICDSPTFIYDVSFVSEGHYMLNNPGHSESIIKFKIL